MNHSIVIVTTTDDVDDDQADVLENSLAVTNDLSSVTPRTEFGETEITPVDHDGGEGDTVFYGNYHVKVCDDECPDEWNTYEDGVRATTIAHELVEGVFPVKDEDGELLVQWHVCNHDSSETESPGDGSGCTSWKLLVEPDWDAMPDTVVDRYGNTPIADEDDFMFTDEEEEDDGETEEDDGETEEEEDETEE